jgi:hypothetical protein
LFSTSDSQVRVATSDAGYTRLVLTRLALNAGQSCKDKLENLRKKLDKTGAEALVVSMLDEVAWLFNLRGADIAYNPVRSSGLSVDDSRC